MTYGQDQLSAYLRRIGVEDPVRADRATLHRLQRGHRLAIAFENLDIPLGRGISLEPERIFAKLVADRRGGYCFEQNALFLAMIEAIGFAARPLLARVWLATVETPPLAVRAAQRQTGIRLTMRENSWRYSRSAPPVKFGSRFSLNAASIATQSSASR